MASFHFTIKSGKKGSAEEHAAYITRAGKYGKGDKAEDLVATGHGNLPDWAADSQDYWRAADKYERANGAVYREFELSLPNELSLEQQKELAETFIRQQVGDKMYEYAIHSPEASIGKVPNNHLHGMFSDRVPDEIERLPAQHFRRFNRKHPEKGGCRKDSGGRDRIVLRNELVSLRENCALLQNEFLEKYGHSARVDHRSHEARGIDATPERHLGPARVRQMTEDEKATLQAERDENGV
jgi:hypothetical protein